MLVCANACLCQYSCVLLLKFAPMLLIIYILYVYVSNFLLMCATLLLHLSFSTTVMLLAGVFYCVTFIVAACGYFP